MGSCLNKGTAMANTLCFFFMYDLGSSSSRSSDDKHSFFVKTIWVFSSSRCCDDKHSFFAKTVWFFSSFRCKHTFLSFLTSTIWVFPLPGAAMTNTVSLRRQSGFFPLPGAAMTIWGFSRSRCKHTFLSFLASTVWVLPLPGAEPVLSSSVVSEMYSQVRPTQLWFSSFTGTTSALEVFSFGHRGNFVIDYKVRKA